MVFLAGPPNTGRGAVLKRVHAHSEAFRESNPAPDTEANLGEGVALNGVACLSGASTIRLEASALISCLSLLVVL